MTTLPAETGSFYSCSGGAAPEYAACAPAAKVYAAKRYDKMNPASENSLREHVKRRIRRMLKIDALSLHNDSTPAEFIKVLHFPG